MKITILTLFPDYFQSILQSSILKRAADKQLVEYSVINIRDFATDKYKSTDDRPFGGGAGMVMMVEPIDRALRSLPANEERRVLLTSAKGVQFTQEKARKLALLNDVVIICGHYEGVDERVAEHLTDEEIRIGDYVLTGGEPAAAVLIDSIVRLVPGVLGNEESTVGESHDQPGLFGYPQYTRPAVYKNWQVPDILLSGNHAQIEQWREGKRGQGQKKK